MKDDNKGRHSLSLVQLPKPVQVQLCDNGDNHAERALLLTFDA